MTRGLQVVLSTVAAALVAAFLLSGCGSGGSSASGRSGGSGGGTATHVDLATLYGAGGYKSPPASSPKPQPGKRLALLSCGQTVAFCNAAIAGAQEAARAVGWTTTVIDSKGDADTAVNGLNQAVAARVDGIYVEAFDCQYIKAALVAAKAAHIPVVGEESRDCDEDLNGRPGPGPRLFTARVNYAQGNFVDWLHRYGQMQADYMIAKTNGHLDAVSFAYSDLAASRIVTDGYQQELKTCPACKDTEVLFTVAEAGSSLQQKAQQALLQHPTANFVRADSDGTVLNGVWAAVAAAGGKLPVMASEGSVGTMDLARQGKDIAGIGIPVRWFGYAGVDILNRLFHGQQPAPAEGPGLQVWDRGHNVPPSGAYRPPLDYQSAFRKAWGLG